MAMPAACWLGFLAAGFGAAAFMAPLLQNLCLSMGDNEEACFCLKVRSHVGRIKGYTQQCRHRCNCVCVCFGGGGGCSTAVC